jgi:hypothetical protein
MFRLFGRKKMTKDTDQQLPNELLWLQDAPLFIDSVQLDRFYDAIARPTSKEGSTTIKVSDETVRSLEGKLNAEAGLTTEKLAAFLHPFFAFAKPSLKATLEGTGSSEKKAGEERSIELLPISTPQRQLVLLAAHYFLNHRNRIYLVDRPAEGTEWRDKNVIAAVPRAVAFLNFPSIDEATSKSLPSTKLIPTAAEFANGKIVQIYKELNFAAGQPDYPEKGTPDELRRNRKAYWQWFDQNYSATKAMIAVEEARANLGEYNGLIIVCPLLSKGTRYIFMFALLAHMIPACSLTTS